MAPKTAVGIDAGGKDVQAYVAVLLQECSQFLGAIVTGAPGDETGEPVVLILVQIPRTDLSQEADLCTGLEASGTWRGSGGLTGELGH